MNSQPAVNPKTFFRTLNMLFLAMAAAQVIFALVSTFLVLTAGGAVAFFTPQVIQVFLGVVILLVLGGIVSGRLIFFARMTALRNQPDFSGKLQGYQTSLIIRYAMMEGPCLVALIIFYLTGNFIFLGIAVVAILVFIGNYPSGNRLAEHLQLHDDERLLLG